MSLFTTNYKQWIMNFSVMFLISMIFFIVVVLFTSLFLILMSLGKLGLSWSSVFHLFSTGSLSWKSIFFNRYSLIVASFITIITIITIFTSTDIIYYY